MSPIFLKITRLAVCSICDGSFELSPEEKPPEKCSICGSYDWQWGPESKVSGLIRQGINRERRSLNPGAASRARQQHGKKQWRQFRGKPVENKPPEGDN